MNSVFQIRNDSSCRREEIKADWVSRFRPVEISYARTLLCLNQFGGMSDQA